MGVSRCLQLVHSRVFLALHAGQFCWYSPHCFRPLASVFVGIATGGIDFSIDLRSTCAEIVEVMERASSVMSRVIDLMMSDLRLMVVGCVDGLDTFAALETP